MSAKRDWQPRWIGWCSSAAEQQLDAHHSLLQTACLEFMHGFGSCIKHHRLLTWVVIWVLMLASRRTVTDAGMVLINAWQTVLHAESHEGRLSECRPDQMTFFQKQCLVRSCALGSNAWDQVQKVVANKVKQAAVASNCRMSQAGIAAGDAALGNARHGKQACPDLQ